jgi:DNA repair photolyase
VFVRWSNLEIESEERAHLPGYRDEAVVRHFEAPDAVPTRFYEIRAKSILNRVPEASRMPFRWTINPYRGCTHACAYCVGGETRVLMSTGREKPIRELEVGETIYGTRREGSYRRLVETEVLDKWSSVKPAFRVALEDGGELVASEEHRFLTRRGWTHVIGGEHGPLRRAHLTVGSRLMGPGGSAEPPAHDSEYRRGYLSGVIRGDGTLKRSTYPRPGGTSWDLYGFRLPPADVESLDRTTEFLRLDAVATRVVAVSAATAVHRPLRAIRTQARAGYERIAELIAWPLLPTLSWTKGFLAGIFDAEGSCSRGILTISNTDDELIWWITVCIRRLGLTCTVEHPRGSLKVVRLRGGLPARMRFMLTVDPAVTRKRSIEGCALKADAPLHVTAIESMDSTMRLYDITTGTGDFIANGVVSHNCFARPTHTYLDFDAGRDFEREIVVKVNAPERLRVELARPSWKGEHIALGTNTDPYQWVEGRYQLMPEIWQAMIDARNPGSVLTKSPLLLRDLALMKELSDRADFSAALSVPTLDERAWRQTEPHTPNPKARLEAIAELTRAGIRTGVLVAPLMPGINDSPEQVAKILELAEEAGAAYVSGIALHLRGEVREVFFDFLARSRPDLVTRYRELYRRGAYAPVQERKRLARIISGPDLDPSTRGRGVLRASTGHRFGVPPERAAEPAGPEQGTLFDAIGT